MPYLIGKDMRNIKLAVTHHSITATCVDGRECTLYYSDVDGMGELCGKALRLFIAGLRGMCGDRTILLRSNEEKFAMIELIFSELRRRKSSLN